MRILIATAGTLILVGASVCAQAPEKPVRVDRLCGFLRPEREVPAKRAGESPTVEDFSPGKMPVRLHLRSEDGPCCVEAALVAETMTHRSGKVEFKKLQVGGYWLVSTIDNQRYCTAIEYRTIAGQQSDCEEFPYTATKSGRFVVKAIVTVT